MAILAWITRGVQNLAQQGYSSDFVGSLMEQRQKKHTMRWRMEKRYGFDFGRLKLNLDSIFLLLKKMRKSCPALTHILYTM